jgi:hypothetical protein
MTLIEKWEKIQTLIDQKQQDFIDKLGGLPTVFYQVMHNGLLKEIPVVKVVHINYDQVPSFSGKRPSKDDIYKIQSIYNNLIFDAKFIRLRYDQHNSYSLKQIEEDKMLFLDRNAAESLSKEITDRIAEEERLLAGGDHERCRRCEKVVPISQMQTHTIIGRGRKQVWNSWKGRYDDKAVVTQEPMRFCSGECAGNEQMSREG